VIALSGKYCTDWGDYLCGKVVEWEKGQRNIGGNVPEILVIRGTGNVWEQFVSGENHVL